MGVLLRFEASPTFVWPLEGYLLLGIASKVSKLTYFRIAVSIGGSLTGCLSNSDGNAKENIT